MLITGCSILENKFISADIRLGYTVPRQVSTLLLIVSAMMKIECLFREVIKWHLDRSSRP